MPSISCLECGASFTIDRCTKGEILSCPKCGLTRPVRLADGRLVLEKGIDYATRALCYGLVGLLFPIVGLLGIFYGFKGQRHGQRQSFCTAGIVMGVVSWPLWFLILIAYMPSHY